MQRYNATGGVGISNSSVGGVSARDNVRADSSFSTSNFSQNSRRLFPLHPFKLKVDREPLNFRLGPPDLYLQTSNCPEETLTKEYLQSGYKETVEGIEEAREIVLTQASYFTKPEIILKCKEALRRRLRTINESRALKRKAGQVYGVPLTGHLLIKSGSFPEQRPSNEDFRKKWIEALSSYSKRLKPLADQVPHGYRKKSLFDVLIHHNVPFLRATWFIKVTYLNQIRPVSASVSSNVQDKAHFNRSELWSKDIVEYLQQLLDDLFSTDGAAAPSKEQSSPTLLSSSVQKTNSAVVISDVEESSLLFKWWYMMHLLHWSYSEGLILPSILVEWLLNQLQERDSTDAYEMLVPIIYDVIEIIAMSQTYTRGLVDIAVRSIKDFSSAGPSLIETSRKSPIYSAFVEILRYLILAVPDTFVGLDCFPLPTSVVADDKYSVHRTLKVDQDKDFSQVDQQDAYLHMSIGYSLFSIQKRAYNLANTSYSSLQGQSAAKVAQVLDKACFLGDAKLAYSALFEDFSDLAIEEKWIAEVNPSLWSSLKWIGTVDMPFICSVFLLCEWAICVYRNNRISVPENHKFTGMKDFSKVYAAVFLLKLKMEHSRASSQSSNANVSGLAGKSVSLHENALSVSTLGTSILKNKSINQSKNDIDVFQSPGPIHDVVVCWLDQHEIGNAGGFEYLQVLIVELIRNGIFYPSAYVRHLIVSGIMDRNATSFDLERRKRHHRILKHLPGSCLFEALQESKVLDASCLNEAVQVYSSERHLVLHGSFGQSSSLITKLNSNASFTLKKQKDWLFASKECSFPSLVSKQNLKISLNNSRPFTDVKAKYPVRDLKVLISILLHFPFTYFSKTQVKDSIGGVKRLFASSGINFDLPGGISVCENCRDGKRQKLLDERSSSSQATPTNQPDDEDNWWVRKGSKSVEFMKIDPASKVTKNVPRGRQKSARKMQSLSQLAAARIEDSQSVSDSYVCDNNLSCPHYRSSAEGKVLKDTIKLKSAYLSDIAKLIKQLRLLEKRSISIWLSASIRQLIDGRERTTSKPENDVCSFISSFDDMNTAQWKLGEEELSTILYIFDISIDMILAVRLLLWLFPKSLCGKNNNGHSSRNMMMLTKSRESKSFIVGEAFLVSALQRYEDVIVATDLLPELLNTMMHRIMAGMTPNARSFGASSTAYTRYLLKKYKDVPSVIRWENLFKVTYDHRLISDFDTGRMPDGDISFSIAVSGGISDFDDYIHHKISGRGSRMKEIVQRHVEEALHYFYGKERKPFALANAISKSSIERWDDAYQVAHEIVAGLIDCIRQSGNAALEGDPSIISSAISSIVSNVGPSVFKVPDFISCNTQSISSTSTSLSCVRYILYIHIVSLCLFKEALGERLGRVFEIALAAEATSAFSGSLSPVKSHRNPYQQSPEVQDINSNHSNEILNNSVNVMGLRTAKVTAALSALILGVIVHGAANLERMITNLKIKEGLDAVQLIRSSRSSSNGISRSIGNFKQEHDIEVFSHWLRLLVGNTSTVCDGLVIEILGESYIIALSRMQRMLPLNLVLPPVYSIFAMVIWRTYIFSVSSASHEDNHLYYYLSVTINEVIRHLPFRDVCFQNTHTFYELLATDLCDSEFAAMLELHHPDKQFKTRALVPLRARLFLNSLIDCKMPPNSLIDEDGSLVSEPIETETFPEMEQNLLNQLVHVLDTLQPAKFHWQWVELRLLLNEKALLEKIDMKDMSLVDAIRSMSPNTDNFTVSESDKFLSEIILTRILVRPDAAPLYAEIVQRLGKSLEESLVMDIKWILAGSDVLLGRKSIKQQLVSVAQRKCLPIKALFWKPWGWSNLLIDGTSIGGENNKLDTAIIEEGEVIDDNSDAKRSSKITYLPNDTGSNTYNQQYHVEKAIAELILPCIDRSSTDLCNSLAVELIKQMNIIDQQINAFTHGCNKHTAGVSSSGIDVSSIKCSSRKNMRGGSPGLGRRGIVASDNSPSSAPALKASIWLRMQFIVRLLPIVLSDRIMRQMLASIILHLAGTRFVHEDADLSLSMAHMAPPKRNMEPAEASTTTVLNFSGESLFDTFLCVLHSLLSSCKPSWMKPKSPLKLPAKSPKEFSVFDREAAEALQADLDRMELPMAIRRRLQAAMPVFHPSIPMHLLCQPPTMPTTSLQPLTTIISGPFQKSSAMRPLIKNKNLLPQDNDNEIDPWTLLEDGTGCSTTSGSNGSAGPGDHSNLKACCWLKGAIRMRRTDLTYIGVLDEES